MRVESLKLTRFRSIETAEIQFSGCTAVVGENNSGKSSVLRALRVFFLPQEEAAAVREGRHKYSSKSFSRIELEFSAVAADPAFTPVTENDRLAIRLTITQAGNFTFHFRYQGSYLPAPDNILDTVKKYVEFILVPPNRNIADLDWGQESLLKVAAGAYIEKALSARDHVTSKFLEAARYVENNVLRRLSRDMVQHYHVNHGISFDIRYREGVSYKDFLVSLAVMTVENGSSFDISECGSGVHSLAAIALYRVMAQLHSKSLLIAIEEPETNLHPQAQREVLSQILAAAGQDTGLQFLITTHSTVIVDGLEHHDIALVRKDKSDQRGFKSFITQIPRSFWQRHDLQEFQYYRFHRYRNSEFFFSRLVIVVESATDADVVRALLLQKGIDLSQKGVSVINLDGVENIKYLYHLLNDLKIPSLYIVDKDYFVPYVNGESDASRGSDGFPKYRYEWKTSSLIASVVKSTSERDRLLDLLKKNHSRALDVLERYGFICMKYSLEVDLVASDTARQLFFNALGIAAPLQKPETLLVQYKKKIKQARLLLHVVDRTPHKNLPHSFKRIKRVIPQLIERYCHVSG